MKTALTLLAGAALLGGALTVSAAPTVYIPLGSGNKVIAVDAATDRITATYPDVENPHGLVATPDGEYLIAGSLKETPVPAGAPHDTPNSKLSLIHPIHGHVMLTVPVTGWTHHQSITPDGRYAISTHPTRGYISVVDLVGNKVVRTVATGPAPNYTLMSHDGKRAFVSNSGNGTISEVDVATWSVVRMLEAGPGPEHLVFSKDERTIYVANPGPVSSPPLMSRAASRRVPSRLARTPTASTSRTTALRSMRPRGATTSSSPSTWRAARRAPCACRRRRITSTR